MRVVLILNDESEEVVEEADNFEMASYGVRFWDEHKSMMRLVPFNEFKTVKMEMAVSEKQKEYADNYLRAKSDKNPRNR